MHDDTVLTGCFGEAGLSGPAVIISPDGSEYRGGCVNCSLNDKGHLQSDHAFYKGEFCDGKFEGSGKQQCWLGGQCTKDDLKFLAFYRGKFKSGQFEDDGTQMNVLFFNDAVVTETLPVLHPTSLRKTAVPNEKKGSAQIGNDRATMP